jgi:hypothetical protein
MLLRLVVTLSLVIDQILYSSQRLYSLDLKMQVHNLLSISEGICTPILSGSSLVTLSRTVQTIFSSRNGLITLAPGPPFVNLF